MHLRDLPLDFGGGELLLEARDPALNIARTWRITARRDLFGWIVVEWHWGRIGTRGQVSRAGFAAERDAARLVRRLLARRDGAKRRIGVSYATADTHATY